MAPSVRARRPASPPPGLPHSVPAQRFPAPNKNHLDADERRAAASRGYGPSRKPALPPGGFDITSGEWKLLAVVLVIASAVRLFRISRPDSVVYVFRCSGFIIWRELTACWAQVRRGAFWKVRGKILEDAVFRGRAPAISQTAHNPGSVCIRIRWRL